MEQSQKKESLCAVCSRVWPIIFTIIITAIVVGTGVYLWQNNETTLDVSIDSVGSVEEKKERSFDPAYRDFASQNQENSVVLPKKIANQFGGEGSHITSMHTPAHPINTGVVFFSTAENRTGDWENNTVMSTNKIFSYNNTGDLTLLHEERKGRLLRTMGIDGSKLVVVFDGIDNSPGPCFSHWVSGHSFGYFDLSDLDRGLQAYTIPEYQKEVGRSEIKQCEKDMGFN